MTNVGPYVDNVKDTFTLEGAIQPHGTSESGLATHGPHNPLKTGRPERALSEGRSMVLLRLRLQFAAATCAAGNDKSCVVYGQ